MKAALTKISVNFKETLVHTHNYYVIPDKDFYGDFLRSVELTYFYSRNEKTIEVTSSSLYVRKFMNFFDLAGEGKDATDLFIWYKNKKDILKVIAELFNTYETIMYKASGEIYSKSIPALVYDEKLKDWIISDTKKEIVYAETYLTSRDYRMNTPNIEKAIINNDIPFRIIQALHYFNNLVKAEKVPNWVQQILDDYEAYCLLSS